MPENQEPPVWQHMGPRATYGAEVLNDRKLLKSSAKTEPRHGADPGITSVSAEHKPYSSHAPLPHVHALNTRCLLLHPTNQPSIQPPSHPPIPPSLPFPKTHKTQTDVALTTERLKTQVVLKLC